jgi:hypothetical protein
MVKIAQTHFSQAPEVRALGATPRPTSLAEIKAFRDSAKARLVR